TVLPGKNTFGNTSAAAVPYRKKSYHSMVVPTVLATIARSRWVRTAGLGMALADMGGLLPRHQPVNLFRVMNPTDPGGAQVATGRRFRAWPTRGEPDWPARGDPGRPAASCASAAGARSLGRGLADLGTLACLVDLRRRGAHIPARHEQQRDHRD